MGQAKRPGCPAIPIETLQALSPPSKRSESRILITTRPTIRWVVIYLIGYRDGVEARQ